VLGSFDGHTTWANSAALAAAGIDATTPDPPQGHIERDELGEPIGVFHETARALVERIKPVPHDSTLAEALRRGQAYLHGLGIAAWLDAIVDPRDERVYLDLASRGELTGRAVLALRWDAGRGLEQLPDLEARREAIESHDYPQLRPSAVKLFADGVIESSTAALLEPYADGSASDVEGSGSANYDPVALARICTALEAAGFDVHAHAIGDRAVRDVLDALSATAPSTAGSARHVIAHLELVADVDIQRFAELGVIPACQPLWAVHDETDTIVRPRLGAHRLERRYPFGRLRDAGAQLAMGSDWNVSSADPLHIMHAAMTRTPPASPDATPLGPATERLGLEDVLSAYTAGSANALRLERETGSIEVGKSADLVLLEGDPFASGVALTDCRVRMTFAAGRVVHAP
jgi:predicted amidohydrolase YtcJ